jgi:hypothetical protein
MWQKFAKSSQFLSSSRSMATYNLRPRARAPHMLDAPAEHVQEDRRVAVARACLHTFLVIHTMILHTIFRSAVCLHVMILHVVIRLHAILAATSPAPLPRPIVTRVPPTRVRGRGL